MGWKILCRQVHAIFVSGVAKNVSSRLCNISYTTFFTFLLPQAIFDVLIKAAP